MTSIASIHSSPGSRSHSVRSRCAAVRGSEAVVGGCSQLARRMRTSSSTAPKRQRPSPAGMASNARCAAPRSAMLSSRRSCPAADRAPCAGRRSASAGNCSTASRRAAACNGSQRANDASASGGRRHAAPTAARRPAAPATAPTGWPELQIRAELQFEGVERQAVAQVVGRHRQRPAVGLAAHHPLAALTMRADAAPRRRRLVGQPVGFGFDALLQQTIAQPVQGGARIVAQRSRRARGALTERVGAPHRVARAADLIVDGAKRLPVGAAHRAGHQQQFGMAWAGDAHQPRRQHQLVGPWLRHRLRRRRTRPPRADRPGSAAGRRHCHRNTPSR